MATMKMTIAYDGTAYCGWQVQPRQRTLQQTIEQALKDVTGAPIRVLASGRTDAGVHALGQVVGFSTESHLAADALRRAVQSRVPPDIAIIDVTPAADNFHPIRDAVSKRYRYVLSDALIADVFSRRYCWQYPVQLSASAMARAGELLVGKHDFASFQSSGSPRESTIRTISHLTVERQSNNDRGEIWVEVEADGFLYNMVRAIVGTLTEVGRGAESEDWCGQVLAALDRSHAGPTAPPQGLFLLSVDYGAKS
ncbi:MAG: tRNA pseudouridine(38-40) synthase TruA [Planctomycetaceae bacterium]|nr:tRNA pseudouridine(38-40) synthase TruA [Planctomycetaceae bacterium]|tara:strand:+ start:553 stop:1311 length:759 start_codon:yes stop_codon:yes gene_type:complete